MKRCIRFFAFILILALCALPCAAVEYTDQSLDELMEEFRAAYQLTEQNFSLCYYDTVTGEEYRFNDKRFMVAASTFKLPLNLYYYEMEANGEIASDAYVGGYRLDDAHYQSLVWSDNDVSIAMLYNLGNFRTYKQKLEKYYTLEQNEITNAYYVNNNFCTAMMLDTLKYLYERADSFEEMLDYMKEAQPEEYFAAYVPQYDVAHKYGFFYDKDKGITAVNDVGIIYAPQPFLLAVYTENAPTGGAEVVARACELLTAYNAAQAQPIADEAEARAVETVPEDAALSGQMPAAPAAQEGQAAPEASAEAERGEEEESIDETISKNLWWMILIAAGIFLTADFGIIYVLRKRPIEEIVESDGEETAPSPEEEENSHESTKIEK